MSPNILEELYWPIVSCEYLYSSNAKYTELMFPASIYIVVMLIIDSTVLHGAENFLLFTIC